MAFEERRNREDDRENPVVIWKRRMARIQRRLRRAEDSLEQAASDFDQLLDEVETGSTQVPPHGRPLVRDRGPLPIATAFAPSGSGAVTFAVHGVEFRVELTRAQLVLLTLLAMPAKENVDHLVGFKTTPTLVHALRARGFGATRRSVVGEVWRVRQVLGSANCELLENKRNAGYRFRLIRSAAAAGRVSC